MTDSSNRPTGPAEARRGSATIRARSRTSSSTAVTVIPAALAAAIPVTPHEGRASSAITASPAAIASAGYQEARAPQKYARQTTPTTA